MKCGRRDLLHSRSSFVDSGRRCRGAWRAMNTLGIVTFTKLGRVWFFSSFGTSLVWSKSEGLPSSNSLYLVTYWKPHVREQHVVGSIDNWHWHSYFLTLRYAYIRKDLLRCYPHSAKTSATTYSSCNRERRNVRSVQQRNTSSHPVASWVAEHAPDVETRQGK